MTSENTTEILVSTIYRYGKYHPMQATLSNGKPRCQQAVFNTGRSYSQQQCERGGKLLEERIIRSSLPGEANKVEGPFWYCRQHAPSVIEAKRIEKREQSQREYEARQRSDAAKAARRERRVELFEALDAQPADVEAIMEAFRLYKAAGGSKWDMQYPS